MISNSISFLAYFGCFGGPVRTMMYQRIVDSFGEGIWVCDVSGITTYVNEIMASMLGWKPAEMIGKPIFYFTDAIGREKAAENLVLRKERRVVEKRTYDFEFVTKDGSRVWTLVSAAPVLDKEGIYQGSVAIVVPITERKLSEERFAKAFELNRTPMLISTVSDGRYIDVNEAFLRVMGYSREEVIGKTSTEINVWTSDTERAEVLNILVEKGCLHSFESRFRTKDGSIRSFLINVDIIELNREKYLLSSMTDITDRKRAEEWFQKAFRLNRSPMVMSDVADGRCLVVNQAFLSLMGFTMEEVIGKTSTELKMWLSDVDREVTVRQLKSDGYLENYECLVGTKSGEVRYCLLNVEIIDIDEKKYILTSMTDITDRKRIEDRLQKTFGSNPNPIAFSTSHTGRFIEVNDSFIKLTGYGRSEVIGRTSGELDLWVESEKRGNLIQQLTENGCIRNEEFHIRTKGGKQLTVLMNAELLSYEGELCIVSAWTDVTAIREYEREFLRLDRLNLIGQMAAGIGHEVRNPLTVVKGYLQRMQAHKDLEPWKESYELMLEEIDRANWIISEFLSFSHERHITVQCQDINVIITHMYPLMEAEALKEDKEILLQLGCIPMLCVDRKEFRQVILNLVNNALDASTPKGKVVLQTYRTDEGVGVSVRDAGPGIPKEIQHQIGVPFFTTKDAGTGLGLAACYSIAAKHKARLSFQSVPGETVFSIMFPFCGCR